jgi:hypothetical protein
MDQGKDLHKGTACGKDASVKDNSICTEHNKDKALCADQHQGKPVIVPPQHKK